MEASPEAEIKYGYLRLTHTVAIATYIRGAISQTKNFTRKFASKALGAQALANRASCFRGADVSHLAHMGVRDYMDEADNSLLCWRLRRSATLRVWRRARLTLPLAFL
jgi:hypothetical protein